MDTVESLGKKWEKLEYSIILHEINCAEKTFRLLAGISYDNEGKVIDSYGSPTEWVFIVPESNGEDLYKEICK